MIYMNLSTWRWNRYFPTFQNFLEMIIANRNMVKMPKERF